MTLTKKQRAKRPRKYIRKDARTKIYRVLYGIPSKMDGKGGPSVNEHRKMPEGFKGPDAVRIWDLYLEQAEFTAIEHAALERRLEQVVRFYK